MSNLTRRFLPKVLPKVRPAGWEELRDELARGANEEARVNAIADGERLDRVEAQGLSVSTPKLEQAQTALVEAAGLRSTRMLVEHAKAKASAPKSGSSRVRPGGWATGLSPSEIIEIAKAASAEVLAPKRRGRPASKHPDKPWEAEGVTRRTWERRAKAKADE